VRRLFIDDIIVSVGGDPAWIWAAFEPDLHRCMHIHRGAMRKYGGVPIYTDDAGWCADACGWAGAEQVVYDRPLRNLMERMVQYLKDRTEAFDDPFPVGGQVEGAFECMGRPPLEWREEGMPRRLNGPRPILPLG
jgi:transposase-like protein